MHNVSDDPHGVMCNYKLSSKGKSPRSRRHGVGPLETLTPPFPAVTFTQSVTGERRRRCPKIRATETGSSGLRARECIKAHNGRLKSAFQTQLKWLKILGPRRSEKVYSVCVLFTCVLFIHHAKVYQPVREEVTAVFPLRGKDVQTSVHY